MRRTGLWLGLNACSALSAGGFLSACGPTFAMDDAGVVPDADNGRPISPPPVDADMDADAGSPPSLLISEVRSRGAGGGSDEFVEFYNPSDAAVTLDASWTLDGRSDSAVAYSARWVGSGKTIPGHGHFLVAGTAYMQQPDPDASLLTGITDATALRLSHAGTVVDALCYAFDATTSATFSGDASYICEGTPAMNPHDNSGSVTSNVDASLERKPGGDAGNGQDTNDNATDFGTATPANPQSSASPPTR